jgi:hypothetical protein
MRALTATLAIAVQSFLLPATTAALAAPVPAAAPGAARPAAALAAIASSARSPSVAEPSFWPPGTEIVHFENVEGMILLTMTLRGGGRDTSGSFVLDSGAGYLALDLPLARALGIADSLSRAEAVDLSSAPLQRLSLGGWTMDQVEPVLTVDAAIIRRVTDRPVLGLLGQKPLGGRMVWVDYRDHLLAFVPAESPDEIDQSSAADSFAAHVDSAVTRSRRLVAGALSSKAIPVQFRLVGDGKILVRARVSDPQPPHWSRPLNLLIDTGATKCVLFADKIAGRVASSEAWPSLRGLSAPTLIGSVEARITRIPEIDIETAGSSRSRAAVARVRGVDAGLLTSDLAQVLSKVTGEPIHGLIGYSFLKHFRVAIDYPHSVLWLDPIRRYQDDRPFEYSHVGLQLERRDRSIIVTGVAEGSPASRAGIARGDELISVGGKQVRAIDLAEISRRMEGPPGTPLTLVTRRGSLEHTHRLVRRRLL